MSQEELASSAGMDRTFVGGIERGEENPSFEKLLRLARVLELTPSELIARAEEQEQRDS